MPPPRTVVKSAVLAALFYTVLMVPWPGLGTTYASWFRAAGNATFRDRFWVWGEGRVSFFDLHSKTLRDDVQSALPGPLPPSFRPPRAEGVKDTLLLLQKANSPGVGFLRTASRPTGYWPAAMFLAVALATPIGWKRKLLGVLLGLLVINGLVAFRVSVMLAAQGFGIESKAFSLFAPSEFWRDILKRADNIFADNPTFSYIVPIIIWAFVLALLNLLSKRRVRSAQGPSSGLETTSG